ncbi:MAG: sporulation protein [Thermobispora bispora]|nr:sporulation protein [Thermobispora bispora]
MVFKRMLGALGVGAPSVDTVLANPRVQPGGTLTGEVRLKGGDFDAEIEHITLSLVAQVEIEHGDRERRGVGEFYRYQVSGPTVLRKGENRVLPFQMSVPWETPITEVDGQHLTGMAVGVRTELAIAKAVDKGDLDPIAVMPLPSQRAVLDAFPRLGFTFKGADLEAGHIYGVQQMLPFYQEIEFYAPPQYAGVVSEVELTFVTNPGGMDVVLEVDGRRLGDAIGRFTVSHDEALRTDWVAEIDRWVASLGQYGAPAPGYGAYGDPHGYGPYGHPDPHAYGPHGHPYPPHHSSGPGWGTVAAAGAAGLIGGMIAGEVVEEIVEEIFEDDGGDGGDW